MRITVRNRNGYFVVKSDGASEDLYYDPDDILRLGAPRIPGPGKEITFEAKKK